MEDSKQPIKTIFHRLSSERPVGDVHSIPHLRPLSIYSRNITCDADARPGWNSSNPFRNIKIEIVNNAHASHKKRRLEDSCLDETYETPLKKTSVAKSASPDLACVLDSSDTSPDVKPTISKSPSTAEQWCEGNALREGDNNTFKGCQSVSSLNHQSRHSGKSGRSDVSVGQRSPLLSDARPENLPFLAGKVTMDLGPAFDFDVDEIMCLSPISRGEEHGNSEGLDDFIESCHSFYEERDSRDLSGGQDSVCKPGQSSKQDQGSGVVGEGEGSERNREESRSDEGYFTKSFKMAAKTGSKAVTQPSPEFTQMLPPLPQVMSTPVAKPREGSRSLRAAGEKEPSSPTLKNEPAEPAVILSLSLDEEACTATGMPLFPLLGSEGGGMEGKDGVEWEGEEEVCNIGVPIHESSVLPEKVSPKAVGAGDEDKNTLPFQGQSKVVAPSTQSNGSKPSPPQPQQSSTPATLRRTAHRPVQRPVVFAREEDWNIGKKNYMDSVTRHMMDARAEEAIPQYTDAMTGVMSELLQLMNAVASQGTGSDGKPWQHPSDLTRRNYQACNGKRMLSLDEWQNQNYRDHRRFAKVPQVFERSPIPSFHRDREEGY